MKAIVDRKKCDGCGWLIEALCVKACPERAIETEGYPGSGRVAIIDQGLCIGCEKCKYVCDEDAIKMGEEDFIEAKDIENINTSKDSGAAGESIINLWQTISEDQQLKSIQSLLKDIDIIDKKQAEAKERLEHLQSEIIDSQEEAKEASKSAMSAVREALDAADKPTGLLKTGKAVEALKVSHKSLSESGACTAKVVQKLVGVQNETAKVQESTMDAVKVLFDFDREIIETTKSLFMIGCSSIAAARTVRREIEMRMNDASREEISAMAKAELMSVAYSLRAQETLLDKQDKFSEELEKQATLVENNSEDLVEIKKREAELTEQENKLSERIDQQENIITLLRDELEVARQDVEKLKTEINSKSIYIVGAIAIIAVFMNIVQFFL